jgi:hypothetical protein
VQAYTIVSNVDVSLSSVLASGNTAGEGAMRKMARLWRVQREFDHAHCVVAVVGVMCRLSGSALWDWRFVLPIVWKQQATLLNMELLWCCAPHAVLVCWNTWPGSAPSGSGGGVYVSVSGGSDATNTFITIDHIIATANTAGALPYVMTPCLRRLWHAVRECIEFVPRVACPLAIVALPSRAFGKLS